MPAAASAEYSPSEWPATKSALRCNADPASLSSTRNAAIDTAIKAGWAFSVSVSVSAGPFHMTVGEFFAERGIDFLEHRARRRKGIGQRLAHANGLRSLTGKNECCSHRPSLQDLPGAEMGVMTASDGP